MTQTRAWCMSDPSVQSGPDWGATRKIRGRKWDNLHSLDQFHCIELERLWEWRRFWYWRKFKRMKQTYHPWDSFCLYAEPKSAQMVEGLPTKEVNFRNKIDFIYFWHHENVDQKD